MVFLYMAPKKENTRRWGYAPGEGAATGGQRCQLSLRAQPVPPLRASALPDCKGSLFLKTIAASAYPVRAGSHFDYDELDLTPSGQALLETSHAHVC